MNRDVSLSIMFILFGLSVSNHINANSTVFLNLTSSTIDIQVEGSRGNLCPGYSPFDNSSMRFNRKTTLAAKETKQFSLNIMDTDFPMATGCIEVTEKIQITQLDSSNKQVTRYHPHFGPSIHFVVEEKNGRLRLFEQ